jgi:ribose-phosphate pyrophosphokinase
MAEMSNEMKVFAGNSNPALADEICQTLNQALGRADVGHFPEGESKVKINENVRGADVFIIQSTCPPVNDNLMELLVMIDAARRASARRITAVIPYFGYARQDRKDQPRVPITAKLVANLIAEAGADRVLTMDLHAQQIQGFFDIPVDHLIAMPVLAEHFKKLEIPNLSICTADVGGIKGAWKFAERLNAPLAIVDKKRSSDTKVEALALIGDVKGKNIVIPDDMIATGGSLAQAAKFVREHGAKDLYAACTHGVLSGDAIASLKAAGFSEIVMTNTIPHDPAKLGPNYRQLSIAKIFGEAILRIHKETSVSSLFE